MSTLLDIARVYEGSDGDATKAFYDRLTTLGPIGAIALNLFRAHKNSARAKVYRGGGYRGKAYERKQWAMENVVKILTDSARECGITWGWAMDQSEGYHSWVLYVDMPTGQVSFHTRERGGGPDYPGKWDGAVNAGAGRIIAWCARLLEAKP